MLRTPLLSVFKRPFRILEADTFKSPMGYIDQDNVWDDEGYSYDKNLATFAKTNVGSYSWSSWLILTLDSPIQCDGIRFFASIAKFNSYDRVQVEVRKDGIWVQAHVGDFIDNEWNEILFIQGSVDQARISFYNREGIPFVRAELFEFEFKEVISPEPPPPPPPPEVCKMNPNLRRAYEKAVELGFETVARNIANLCERLEA